MAQIIRKWVEDAAINNEKIDEADVYTITGLLVDSTNGAGRIGIGVTEPLDAIHIRRPDTSAGLMLDLNDGAFGRTYQLYSSPTGVMNIQDHDTGIDRFTLKSTTSLGNIGISTVDPLDTIHARATIGSAALRLDLDDGIAGQAYQLASNSAGDFAIVDVDGGSATRFLIDSTGTTTIPGDTTLGGNFQVNGTTVVINTEIVITDQLEINQTDTTQAALIASQDNAAATETVVKFENVSALNHAFTVDRGYVGFGTTDPQAQLHVEGDIVGKLTASPSNIGSTTRRIGTIYMASDVDYAANLRFLENTTERVTFLTGGNVGINSAVPTVPLDVVGAIAGSTSITAGNGITATLGNIVATAGQVNANTTMSAGGNIASTGGTVRGQNGIIATTGGVLASAGGVTATLGNIVATAGQVNANTTMSAGGNIASTGGTVRGQNGIIATTGGVSALSSGNITAASGTISTASGNILVGSGNLGVGSAIPTAKVDVSGAIKATGAMTAGGAITTTVGNLSTATGNIITSNGDILTSSGQIYAAHANGQVGIGTNSVTATACLGMWKPGSSGSVIEMMRITVQQNAAGSGSGIDFYTTGNRNVSIKGYTVDSNPSGAISIWVNDATPVTGTGFLPRLTINKTNVGIGTDAPSVPLEVVGAITASGGLSGNSLAISSTSAQLGNVGIGTVSHATTKLDVFGSATVSGNISTVSGTVTGGGVTAVGSLSGGSLNVGTTSTLTGNVTIVNGTLSMTNAGITATSGVITGGTMNCPGNAQSTRRSLGVAPGNLYEFLLSPGVISSFSNWQTTYTFSTNNDGGYIEVSMVGTYGGTSANGSYARWAGSFWLGADTLSLNNLVLKDSDGTGTISVQLFAAGSNDQLYFRLYNGSPSTWNGDVHLSFMLHNGYLY